MKLNCLSFVLFFLYEKYSLLQIVHIFVSSKFILLSSTPASKDIEPVKLNSPLKISPSEFLELLTDPIFDEPIVDLGNVTQFKGQLV